MNQTNQTSAPDSLVRSGRHWTVRVSNRDRGRSFPSERAARAWCAELGAEVKWVVG